MRTLLAADLTVAALLSIGCGTAVYDHQFEVVINDPTGRLGSGPVDISIFDKVMGYSEEWARRTMGVATATKPYVGTVGDTATKWAWDSSLPPSVVAGLAVPAVEKNGYFVVDISPVRGTAKTAALAFAPYGSYFPEGNTVAPLAVRYEGEPAGKGWRIRLTVDIPPK
jgi:hypothetical protein